MVHGKSILSCILCKEFSKIKQKTLLIDFDVFNNSINTIFNVPKYPSNTESMNIKENIIEVSKYEHLLCSTDMIFSDENSFNYINLEKLIKDLKKQYKQIVIDTTSNYQYKYLKMLFEIANDIVYIIVPNISDLKKAIKQYEILIEDFKIEKEKIKLFINKENNYSVDSMIVSKMFGNLKISGTMKYNEAIEANINNKKSRKIKINSII